MLNTMCFPCVLMDFSSYTAPVVAFTFASRTTSVATAVSTVPLPKVMSSTTGSGATEKVSERFVPVKHLSWLQPVPC